MASSLPRPGAVCLRGQLNSNVRHAVLAERNPTAGMPHMRHRLYRTKQQWPKTKARTPSSQFRIWRPCVQARRRATSTQSLGRLLEAPSRAGSTCMGGPAQNEVAQSSAATLSAAYKTIATSGAVGYAVTLRLQSEVVGVWGVWASGAHAVGPDA